MTEKKHAILSPSSAERWLNCPASVALCKNIPDETSVYESEGTLAHEFAEQAARCAFRGGPLHLMYEVNGKNPADPITKTVEDVYQSQVIPVKTLPPDEMFEAAKAYYNTLCALIKVSGGKPPLFAAAEYRVTLSELTGEKDAGGTADCVMLLGDTLHIVDFKYGKGVRVDVEGNPQLLLYCIGVYDELVDLGFTIKHCALTICQPRIGNTQSWPVPMDFSFPDPFHAYRNSIAERAARALALYNGEAPTAEDYPTPFEPNLGCCRFCRAKGICPCMGKAVTTELAAQFDDAPAEIKAIPVPDTPERLAKAYSYCDLIDTWVKNVRSRVQTELREGRAVPGYKLVVGSKGKRAWADKDEAQALVKSMRLPIDEAYKKEILSPTQMEKLVKKGVIGPRQWQRFESLIVRAPATQQIAPQADPRPAIDMKSVDAQLLEDD